MKKFLSILALATILSVVSSAKVYAVVLFPTVDGTLFDLNDDGFGDFINPDESVQAGGSFSHGIIEFDLSGISAPSNAFLRLYEVEALGPFPLTIDVYGYSADGALSLVDYADGTFLRSFNYNDEDTIDVDLTPDVQSAVTNAYSFLGLNLRLPGTFEPGPIPYGAFGSLDEFGPPSELHITENTGPVVPEPASLLLLGSGLSGALARRRSSSKA